MLSYVVVALLSVSLAVLFIPPDWSTMFGTESSKGSPVRLLSRSELALHGGQRGSKGLYLAILGHVFDVHKGEKHYGPGGAYHFMAGKDASLAFITGDFTESGLTDDVSSLSPLEVVALYDWLAFYQRDYQNVEWTAASGGRFWCSTKSGGVARHWAGVPRQLFSPGSSGVRCVCVEDPIAAEEDPNLQKYDGCPAHAESCSVGAH
ncbi:neuferricin isoform X2 [Pundamilia nyererei]|uniref:Neuferricin n=1 Tax=Pundamilia nyererei TaxID=303518 RepID=A0A9Y6M5P4_9CICH|nr:PREDICTED: neuferricin isoform X2 [Pundamilia nyererei]